MAGVSKKRRWLYEIRHTLARPADRGSRDSREPTQASKTVDFLFAGHRLNVETDSWAYHKTRRSFESDRERDALLARAGYRTLRFTDRQLTKDPATVAETVSAALTPTAPR